MKTYQITYDLIKERGSADYTKLHNAIKALGAWCHPVESTWLVLCESNVASIRDTLWKQMDENDKLLVTRAGPEGAWIGLATEVSTWLKQNLS